MLKSGQIIYSRQFLPFHATADATLGVVQKVTFLGNTDNVNFGWFAYDSTDGHPKKCYPILNHAHPYSYPYPFLFFLCHTCPHADEFPILRRPMLVAYADPEGQPVLSFRSSVQAYGDDQLAMWIRSANGAFIQAIRNNPRVAFVYRNEETKATYNFQSRARVSELESDRHRVFDASPEAERGHDFAMLGVVVLVDLDRVKGYAGLGPSGQMDQVRMLRGTGAN